MSRGRIVVEKVVLPCALVLFAILMVHSGWLERWDDEFYDWQLRSWERPAPQDIVIITIDEKSLAEFGRWPWRRDLHGDLIQRINRDSVKAVGLDLILSEPDIDYPQSDAHLAQSIQDNGRVVLPMSYGEQGGMGLTEFLPMPEFTSAAASLGHVSFPIEADGIVRGQYLKAGIGESYWPSFALAMLSIGEPEHPLVIKQQNETSPPEHSPYQWVTSEWNLIPFSKRPEQFSHISFSDVMRDNYPLGFFADKYVFIGVTAAGLGNMIATPQTATSRPLFDVEINAQVLDALRHNLLIKKLPPFVISAISALIVLATVFAYYYQPPRRALIIGALTLCSTLALSFILLRGFNLWFPPSAAMLALVISYPLWSWRRLELAAYTLLQTQKRALITLESIADAVITTNNKGIVEYLNPVAESMTGYSLEDAQGRSFARIFRVIDEKTHAPIKFPITQCISDHRRILLPENNLLLSKTGRKFCVHASATPIMDNPDEPHGIAVAFSDVTELRQVTQRMHYQAMHDSLTQLPNRVLLHDRLIHAISRSKRNGNVLAVVFLDLDDFKKVNDSLGHTAGDELLVKVVERIEVSSRQQDTLARLGGDEFVLLLEDLSDIDTVHYVVKKLLKSLEAPFDILGHQFVISGSAGISLYPSNGETPEALLQNADTAMYQAKTLGRNTYQFFDDEMSANVVKRMSMEQSLHRAIEQNQLELYYQLQVSSHSLKAVGVECLLRWKREDGSYVSPAEFIPLAEETGLIIPIGDWVIRTACKHTKAWLNIGIDVPRVSINLSPRQFLQKQLPSYMEQILAEAELESRHFGVEITESTIMHDISGAIETLNDFRNMGFHLSIDDFGTGYSSLSYLKQFPVDQLKIDKSFVSNITTEPNDAAISEAIIAMAHSMNLSVIAEGVETEEQVEFLCTRGCNEMQGYRFSRPLPYEQMTELLTAAS